MRADKRALSRCCSSNGNLVAATGDGGRGRRAHWASGRTRSRSPRYLFAMVAANLELLEDHFTTRSGKKALLQIYVEPGKLDQAGFAMDA